MSVKPRSKHARMMDFPLDYRLRGLKMAYVIAVLSLLCGVVSAYGGVGSDGITAGLQCCRFNFGSPEFIECCKQQRGCPDDCDFVFKDAVTGAWVRRPDCIGSYECCVYQIGTKEFDDCCNKYGCCPICDKFSDNCCFNGTTYPWGEVIWHVPECCINLVCGAKLHATKPFLMATIVPVQIPQTYGQYCEAKVRFCVQGNGVIREEGSEWFETLCRLCRCEGGVVTCRPVRPKCPPAPEPHCIQRPGDCCPLWDCTQSTGCVDEAGNRHEVGDVWPDPADPCFILTCTTTGIQRSRIPCHPLPPPPHSSCTVEPRDCCYKWTCTGCVDSAGVHREVGENWTGPADPCTTRMCIDGGIINFPVHCPRLPPQPHARCTRVLVDCCEEWNCTSGCVDYTGNRRQEGEVWRNPADPCFTLACTTSGIHKSHIPCPPLPPSPHSGCTLEVVNCCYNWTCSGCVDESGMHHELGSTWTDKVDGCTTHMCTESGIISFQVVCAQPPPRPHASCTLVTVDCCQQWNCSGCVDSVGVQHEVGTTWTEQSDPCTTYMCTPNGKTSFSVDCTPLPPQPHAGCTKVVVGCCERWDCKFCIDNDGRRRAVGEEWSETPCFIHTCFESGIATLIIDCAPMEPRPSKHCIWVHEPHECCGRWECGGCVDEAGRRHKVGDVWPDHADPCFTLTCTASGIQKSHIPCPILPPSPHSGCKLEVINCCHNWTCSSACPDPHSFGRVCVRYKDQCNSDADCYGGRCCLVAGCGRECIPDEKPGSCPVIFGFRVCHSPVDECAIDSTCPGAKKCCKGYCGRICVDPLP